LLLVSGRSYFLKKRTKKLLFIWFSFLVDAPDRIVDLREPHVRFPLVSASLFARRRGPRIAAARIAGTAGNERRWYDGPAPRVTR
jgi:hypothetical protein